MKKYVAVIAAFLMILIVIAGCGSKGSSAANNPSDNTSTSDTVNKSEADKENWKSILYFSDKNAMYLIEEERDIVSDAKQDTAKKAESLVKELIKGSSSNSKELTTTIPKTTKINGVSIEKDTAVVDLSKEFVQDNVGGSAGETMAIAPIVLTLTKLEGINQVSFKIDGKVESEFKGHYELDHLFTRSEFENYISK